MTIRTHLCH